MGAIIIDVLMIMLAISLSPNYIWFGLQPAPPEIYFYRDDDWMSDLLANNAYFKSPYFFPSSRKLL